jgi:hypothetical protein
VNKTKLPSKTIMMMLAIILMASSIAVLSLISEKNAEATICFDCPGEADKHLDEAKKSLDAKDIEGAKMHIDKAKEILANSSAQ